MHELSITQNLLEITLRHAEKAQAKKVNQLNVVIGQMSSIVDESVQFYWDIVAKDTLAEGSKLHFERVPGALHCLSCQAQFPLPGDQNFLCPHCQSARVRIAGGDEFRLDSIDVE